MTACRAEFRRLLLHLLNGDRLGFAQFLLVGGRAAADDVADTGKEVAEDVGAKDGLAAHDAEVLDDAGA